MGQKVEQGQVLLILEAMKMETEVVAPSAGTIKEILISSGDTVSVGDCLIILSNIWILIFFMIRACLNETDINIPSSNLVGQTKRGRSYP